MIKEINPNEYHIVKDFAYKDVARNYFILLGLESKKDVFHKIYGEFESGELKALLFRRNSGVLQFYAPGEFDIDGFAKLISTLEYNALIGPKTYCKEFLGKGLFSSIKDGAYISKMDKDYIIDQPDTQYRFRDISVSDLDEIEMLYKDCFQNFSSKEVMKEKLKTKRGRGVCIEENGQIISIAQTDFETKDSADIVGVATDINHRCKGLATACVQFLCYNLIKEGKNVYLQYDNLDAGRIYERMGFRRIDQVIHMIK